MMLDLRGQVENLGAVDVRVLGFGADGFVAWKDRPSPRRLAARQLRQPRWQNLEIPTSSGTGGAAPSRSTRKCFVSLVRYGTHATH